MEFCCSQCSSTIEFSANETALHVCPDCNGRLEATESHGRFGPGYQIEQFTLTENVGSGSYGTVWRAYDADLERFVAIKIAKSGRLDKSSTLDEARAASRVKHPGIVDIYEIGEVRGRSYIVTEFVEGGTLENWRREKRPGFAEVARVCVDICRAVHAVHEGGVLHRDLKPENILIDAKDQVHVTDFGIAKRDYTTANEERSQLRGSPAYMSPEQAQCEPPSYASDVYSIGAVLHFLLAGKAPFHGSTSEVLGKVIAGEVPPLPEHVPSELRKVCGKAMSQAPEERFGSPDELSLALAPFIKDPAATERQRTSAWLKPSNWWVVISLIVLVAATTYALLPGSEQSDAVTPEAPTDPKVPAQETQSIRIAFSEPVQRVRFVPLWNRTCMPHPIYQAVEVTVDSEPLVCQDLRAGKVLVIALGEDGAFHEVIRTVPNSETPIDSLPNNSWKTLDSGEIELPQVKLFKQPTTNSLLFVEGGFAKLGTRQAGDTSPSYAMTILPYWLGEHEVTAAEFGGSDSPMQAVNLQIDQVLDYAEQRGCRLPTEAELEFALTNGDDSGNLRFIGPCRQHTRPVGGKSHWGHYDLFSGVAELTWSPGVTPRLRITHGPVDIGFESFSIRGVHRELVREERWLPDFESEPGTRTSWSENEIAESTKIGFRLARSGSPRWDWSLKEARLRQQSGSPTE